MLPLARVDFGLHCIGPLLAKCILFLSSPCLRLATPKHDRTSSFVSFGSNQHTLFLLIKFYILTVSLSVEMAVVPRSLPSRVAVPTYTHVLCSLKTSRKAKYSDNSRQLTQTHEVCVTRSNGGRPVATKERCSSG